MVPRVIRLNATHVAAFKFRNDADREEFIKEYGATVNSALKKDNRNILSKKL